jgi:hypothetical protein
MWTDGLPMLILWILVAISVAFLVQRKFRNRERRG